MRLALLICLMVIPQAGFAQPQFPTLPTPPSYNNTLLPMNPTVPPNNNQPSSILQTSSNSSPVKLGDQVRVLQNTSIRSGPGEQSYSCGVLEAGATVTLLSFPAPGSDYTTIAAPANCFSLIPESAIYVWFRPKTLFLAPQKTTTAVGTLIDGEPANGQYLSSGYTLPKGSLVSVVNEKKIKVNGKEKVYCVIRIGEKEKRYVRTADLEGVAEAVRMAAGPPMNTNPYPDYSNHRSSTEPLYGTTGLQQTSLEQEQLPAHLISQVQAADQSYQSSMRSGAWEDARQRYQHLLECEVLSLRILAKNRLEFISGWQKNPPVVTTAMSPQQGAAGYPPTMNREPWIPGSIAPTRPSAPASTTSIPAVPKEAVIRPTQPVTPPANTNTAINVPTYPGNTGNAAQPSVPTNTPPVGLVPARTAPAATTSAQRMKVQGRLNLAVQYSGTDRLFYLTNSQGFMICYVRGVPNTGIQLKDFIGKYVEVEGWGIQASIDGQLKRQINVDRVKPLQ